MAKAKAEKVVIEIDGETFEVDRSALKSVKSVKKKANIPALDKVMKDIRAHYPKLHADLEAMFSDYIGTMKVSVPGVGCKKGSIEFFFGIEGENVIPLDFTMKLTNLDTDQMPAFMDYWCDEGSLKDTFGIYEIWDQVLRMQGSATMDKADKMIEKLDEKYKALRDRVAKFTEDHYGNSDNGVVLDILNYYDASYGGLLE
jgi:hypothetical protein